MVPGQNGADWTEVFNELKPAVKMRHYSPKTLKAYSGWARKLAKELTFVPENNKERRRYHIHETSMQKALRKAVKKAKIQSELPPIRFVTVLQSIYYRRISA